MEELTSQSIANGNLLVTADLVEEDDDAIMDSPQAQHILFAAGVGTDRANTTSPFVGLNGHIGSSPSIGTANLPLSSSHTMAIIDDGLGAIGQPTRTTPGHSRSNSNTFTPLSNAHAHGAAGPNPSSNQPSQPSQLRKTVLDELDSSLAHLTVHPGQPPTGAGMGMSSVQVGAGAGTGAVYAARPGGGIQADHRWGGLQTGVDSHQQRQQHHLHLQQQQQQQQQQHHQPFPDWSSHTHLYNPAHQVQSQSQAQSHVQLQGTHNPQHTFGHAHHLSMQLPSSYHPSNTSAENGTDVNPLSGAGAGAGPIAPPKSAPLYSSLATHGHSHGHTQSTAAPAAPAFASVPTPSSATNTTNTTTSADGSGNGNNNNNNNNKVIGKDLPSRALAHLTALSELLQPLAARADEVEEMKKEIELWKGAWTAAEKEKRGLEGKLKEAQGQVGEKRPAGPMFSAVLIDGDGLIFTDELLRAGFSGGQRAAKTLLSSLPAMLGHASISPTSSTFGTDLTLAAESSGSGSAPSSPSTKVEEKEKEAKAPNRELGAGGAVVNVFFHKSGLGTALVKAGIIATYSMFESFIQGFSASHELFTVVDVGPGKEATDAKIREHLRFYARNAQCEMIVLGASHDNGYANILSSLSTENRLSKLLLLKGYSDLAGQLRQYSSRVVTIPDLFRTSKIPMSFSSVAAVTKEKEKEKPVVPGAPLGKKAAVAAPAVASSKHAVGTAAKTVKAETKAKTPVVTANKKQAKKGKAEQVDSSDSEDDADLDDTLSQSTGQTATTDVIEWSTVWTTVPKSKPKPVAAPAPAPAPAKAAVKGKDAFKKDKKENFNKATRRRGWAVRELDPRPCHTYYLSDRGCRNGEGCGYAHHYDLTDDETDELRRLAKEMVCPYARNNKCHFTEDECVYGHQCPRMDDCKFGDTCRFRHLENGHGELD